MRLATATANAADTDAACRQAAAALIDRLGAEPDLVLLYADARHDAAAAAAALAARFPAAAVMGGSSCLGVMTAAGFAAGTAEGPALALLGIADPAGACGVGAAELQGRPRAAAAAAMEAALADGGRPLDAPGLVWLCAAPGAEEEVLAGIAEVAGPEVPVFGGSSADNEVAGQWWQLAGRGAPRATRDGVALAVLYPGGRLGHAFQSGYEPTDRSGLVTAAEGRELLAIDGVPAATRYRGWTAAPGMAAEGPPSPGIILAESTWAPLARQVGTVEGVPFYALSHPAQVTERATLRLFAELRVGERVTLMSGTESGLIGRIGRVAREALETSGLAPGQVRGALAIYCGGCMLAVRRRMPEVVEALRAALPGVPFLGAFTFGEQGRSVSGGNLHGNLMISVVVLGD